MTDPLVSPHLAQKFFAMDVEKFIEMSLGWYDPEDIAEHFLARHQPFATVHWRMALGNAFGVALAATAWLAHPSILATTSLTLTIALLLGLVWAHRRHKKTRDDLRAQLIAAITKQTDLAGFDLLPARLATPDQVRAVERALSKKTPVAQKLWSDLCAASTPLRHIQIETLMRLIDDEKSLSALPRHKENPA